MAQALTACVILASLPAVSAAVSRVPPLEWLRWTTFGHDLCDREPRPMDHDEVWRALAMRGETCRRD